MSEPIKQFRKEFLNRVIKPQHKIFRDILDIPVWLSEYCIPPKHKENITTITIERLSIVGIFTKHSVADMPSHVVYYYYNGVKYIIIEMWHNNGLLDRFGYLPAKIFYYKNKIYRKDYYVNGLLHNINDRPASIIRRIDDDILMKEWWVDGKRHREGDKPAFEKYDKNFKEILMIWFNNDEQIKSIPAIYDIYGDVVPLQITCDDNHNDNTQHVTNSRLLHFNSHILSYYPRNIHRDNDIPAYIKL